MTILQNCPDVENPQVDLRPLPFRLMEDKGGKAVYQAIVDDSQAPGKPGYALTLTTASPGDDKKAAEQLKEFRAEMRAGFVLTAPNPDEEPCDDQEPEPFKIKAQTQFEFDLVRLTLKGDFGVTVVVQTAVAGETPEADGPATEPAEPVPDEPVPDGLVPFRATVQPRREHRYTAVHGLKTATVTARQGSGTIRKPTKDIVAGGGGRSLRASAIVVRGVTLCVYDFCGRFNRVS